MSSYQSRKSALRSRIARQVYGTPPSGGYALRPSVVAKDAPVHRTPPQPPKERQP